ncbi:MAG: BF3164 family lipoprotein [Gemmatimonadales bacterium]
MLLKADTAFSGQTIGRPAQMIVGGSRAWITDRSGDPYIHLIDLATKRLIASFGVTGDGPGDFQNTVGLSFRPGDTTAPWTGDVSLFRVTRLSPPGDSTRIASISLVDVGFAAGFVWLTRNSLLTLGDFDTNRVRLSDSSGKTLAVYPGQLVGGDSIPAVVRRDLGMGVISCGDAQGHAATVYVGAGRIDLHDSTGRVVGEAAVPFPTNGEFTKNAAGKWRASDVWRYYAACAASPRSVYALFAGYRTDKKPQDAVGIAAFSVHVFDWAGKLTGVFRLEHPASAIAVSGDSLLYAIGEEDANLYRYRLPALSKVVQ